MKSKGFAKKKYFFVDDDLEELDIYETRNPYRPKESMYLFKEKDLIEHACYKYQIDKDKLDDKLKELYTNRENEKQKKINKKDNEMEKRRNKLKDKLKLCKLDLRDDSKLCCGYINGTLKGWKFDDIIIRMCQMHYLYNYCEMDKCIREAESEQIEEFNAGYIPDITILDQAEMIALDKIGGYPKVWPWL